MTVLPVIVRAGVFCFVLLSVAGLLCACRNGDTASTDELFAARTALTRQEWMHAERLIEHYLRDSQDVNTRWEAWQYLLTAMNANGLSQHALLQVLETMLVEFADDEMRKAVILYRIGECAEKMQHFERAAESWKSYVELANIKDEQRMEGYRRLAAIELRLRQFDDGEHALLQCISMPLAFHDKIVCMFDLADQYMAREQWKHVVDLCSQILESKPEGTLLGMTEYMLADALEQQGNRKESLHFFERALKSYPNVSVIEKRIAQLRKKTR